MRLLHVADPHQGLIRHSRPDPSSGLPSALVSVARCWHHAARLAVDVGADAVLVAGDVFHTPNPDSAALTLFDQGLRILGDVPTLIISGNHDRAPHPGRQSVLEVFADEPGVHVSVRPEIVDLDGIKVATLPSVSRQQLLANRPGLTRAEAEQAVIDGLVRIIDGFRREGADVLTGHWSVQGAILGNEKDITIASEPVIPLAELEGPWKHIAFGHIHKFQRIGLHGHYAGSMDRVDFGEENDTKVALEVDLGHMHVTQHELPARRFVTWSWSDGWFDEITSLNVEGAIVRVKGRVPESEAATLDRAAMAKMLYDQGAHIVKIALEVERPQRSRAATVTESLSETDAFEEWMRVREIPETDRPALRERAKELMEGGN